MVAAALGAVGFACRPVSPSPGQDPGKEADPAPPAAAKVPADVEALRREVEDLRATVRVLLKENRHLEKELEDTRGRSTPGARPGPYKVPARTRNNRRRLPTGRRCRPLRRCRTM